MIGKKQEGVAIALLDEHDRWSVSLNGVVRFVGSRAECELRAAILTRPDTRQDQDAMLHRAVQH
jgi:hypothetical protein